MTPVSRFGQLLFSENFLNGVITKIYLVLSALYPITTKEKAGHQKVNDLLQFRN